MSIPMAISSDQGIFDPSFTAPLRLGILMDHPSPHMVPLLNALARRPDCTAEVVYLRDRAPQRNWGSPPGNLPCEFLTGPSSFFLPPRILWAMRRKKVDAWVINSVYSSPNTWMASIWLSLSSIPWVFMNEPPRPRSLVMGALKTIWIRLLFSRAWGIIGTGKKSAEFYGHIFNGQCPVTSIPYYLNLDPFDRLPLEESSGNASPLQFLACCRLVPGKGLSTLLEACRKLNQPNWNLILVGDGPLRPCLEQEIRHSGLKGRIHFQGEIPFGKRPEAFRGKQVFIHPSQWDGWGMVVPEALAAGLPVISTDQVMSAHEFIREGTNGFIIPANDPDSLARRMEFFLLHSDQIPSMSRAARESIREYRPEIGAEQLVRFLSDLVEKKPPPQIKVSGPIFPPPGWRRLLAPQSTKDWLQTTARLWIKNKWISLCSAIGPLTKPWGHRILVYHLVLPEDRPIFAEHLKFLTDHYRVLPLAEFLGPAGYTGGSQEFSLAITFDDGFRVLMEDCLELLEKYQIKATFFVSTGFIELGRAPAKAARFSLMAHHYAIPLEPMREADLYELVHLGHEIASHGVSHTSLGSLSRDQVRMELTRSRERITKWTGISPLGFSYPYGHTQNILGSARDWVEEAGYRYAVTLRRGALRPDADPYLLPREHVEGNWPVSHLRYFLWK